MTLNFSYSQSESLFEVTTLATHKRIFMLHRSNSKIL